MRAIAMAIVGATWIWFAQTLLFSQPTAVVCVLLVTAAFIVITIGDGK